MAKQQNGDTRKQDDTQKQDQLNELAAKIREGHRKVIAAVRTGLEQARRTGEQLIKAKELVRRGEWIAWVRKNCKFTEQEAQRYMRVAQGWKRLEEAGKAVTSLTLTEALGLLSQPNGTPETKAVRPDESAFAFTPDELPVREAAAAVRRADRLTFANESGEREAVEQLIGGLARDVRRKALQLRGDDGPDPVAVAILLLEQVKLDLCPARLRLVRGEKELQPAGQPAAEGAAHRSNGRARMQLAS